MADPASDAPAYARRMKFDDLPVRTRSQLDRYVELAKIPKGVVEELFLARVNRKETVVRSRDLPAESRAWSAEQKLEFMIEQRAGEGWADLHRRFPEIRSKWEDLQHAESEAAEKAKRAARTPWGDRDGWAEEPTLPIRMVPSKEGGERPTEPAYVLYNRLVQDHHYRPFRTSTGDARVAIPTAHGLEIRRPLTKDSTVSKEFVDRVGYELFTRSGSPVPKRDLNESALALAGRALDRSLPEIRVVQLALRLAPEGPFSSRLDLFDRDRRCVSVGPDGWKIETLGHPVFDQRRGMKALPEPTREEGADGWKRFHRLWDFISLPPRNETEDPRLLATALLVHFILAPRSPKPIGLFGGNEGAGKSSSAERFQEVIDPAMPRIIGASSLEDPKEFTSLLMNHAVLNVDNVSSISANLSDDLARLSTGIGFAKRELFTDSGEILGDVCPLVLINGITATPWAPDLLSRVSFLSVVEPEKLVPKEELDREWKTAHPEILGGLLDLVAGTARVLRDSPPPLLSNRMADHVRIGQAVALAMGRPREDFISAWATNVDRQASAAAENPWVSTLVDLFGPRGPASPALLASAIADQINASGKANFPKGVTSVQVGSAIRRVRKTLDRMGVFIRSRTGHGGQLVYFRATEDDRSRSGPALDDASAVRIWEKRPAAEIPETQSPQSPESPSLTSGAVVTPTNPGSPAVTSPPSDPGDSGIHSHRTVTTTVTTSFTPENPSGGDSGDSGSPKVERGEGGSTPAGRGDNSDGSGPAIAEESFDGVTRADRARRTWSQDHPEDA